MLTAAKAPPTPSVLSETMRIAGDRVGRARKLEVRNPYTGDLVGSVPRASCHVHRRASALAPA